MRKRRSRISAQVLRTPGRLIAITALTVAFASRSQGFNPAESENILIVISDDLGVDRTRAYGYTAADGTPIAPISPNIDRLAADGILFRNAWSAPACSSSRAQALTGKYPNRTGIGRPIPLGIDGSEGLDASEFTLADNVPPGYRTAVIGKWHVAGNGDNGSPTSGDDHAPRCGFEWHSGSKGNLGSSFQPYFKWDIVLSQLHNLAATQVVSLLNQYAPTRTTDDALRMIDSFGDQPWLIWVSYNSIHKPYHVPPLHLQQSTDNDLDTDLGKGMAMIEALDSEIGRLMGGIDPKVFDRTTVIYFGDNGTKGDLVVPPFDPDRAKGTVYEGGVHVPFIVRSRRIPAEFRGSESRALVDLSDLLPTVSELLGMPVPGDLDGVSFLSSLSSPGNPSRRSWIFTEEFDPNFVVRDGIPFSQVPLNSHNQAVRDNRHKLIRQRTFSNGSVTSEAFELYDLIQDEFENNNLLDSTGQPPPLLQSTYNRLLQILLRQAS